VSAETGSAMEPVRTFPHIIGLALCLGSVAFAQAVPPPPAVDQAVQKTIQDLKIQALDAHQRSDLVKERALYVQILHLNPDDPTARVELEHLDAERKRKAEEEVRQRLEQNDRRAQTVLIAGALLKAQAALADAKRLGSPDPLDKARQYLGEARAAAGRSTPEIDRVALAVQAEGDLQRFRWWELWGGAGLVSAGVLGALVFSFWRRKAVLEIVDGPDAGQAFVLKKPTTTVGALASEVDWVIADPMRKVSRRHCDVVRNGRHYFIVDRSTNGTLLNGQPLPYGEPTLLRRGDRIGLGGEILLQFR
jgi:hypothetical protein